MCQIFSSGVDRRDKDHSQSELQRLGFRGMKNGPTLTPLSEQVCTSSVMPTEDSTRVARAEGEFPITVWMFSNSVATPRGQDRPSEDG